MALKCECGTCNVCRSRERMRAQRQQDPEHARVLDRARYYRDKEKRRAAMDAWAAAHPERVREIKRDWARRNRHKTSAQLKARRALKKGLIEQKPCEVCGAEEVQMHHRDYSKPLDVLFLCAAHHYEIHRRG